MKKFYKVTTMCGHVRINNDIIVTFPVVAESRKEAAEIGRKIPRVKHNKKYAILACEEISKEEYIALCEENRNDPYLKCKNKQEQNAIEGLEERIIHHDREEKKKHDMSKIFYKKKKQKEYIRSFNGRYSFC